MRMFEHGGPLTFLSLSHGRRIPPSRDNAERLRLMRARLTPVVGNGYFHFGKSAALDTYRKVLKDAIFGPRGVGIMRISPGEFFKD